MMLRRFLKQDKINLVTVFLLLFCPLTAFSQALSPEISIRTGLIKNLQDKMVYADKPHHSPYLEMHLQNKLFSMKPKTVTIRGGLYGGYWNDFVTEASNTCTDCNTRSYSSFITGVLLSVSSEKGYIRPLISVGLSRHFVHADYVAGFGYGGNRGEDFRENFNTAEADLMITIPFSSPFRAELGIRTSYPVDDHWLNEKRHTYIFGISYSL